ncbi:MAG: GtrA family protein [Bacteroidetes bacterium]|nr:GtrA family protein [Bacteroidota bacterium]
MVTFFKAQAASITATVVDFLATIILVEVFHCWYLLGSIIGTVAGGITHFMLSRNWVFNAKDGKVHWQAVKYILVWIVYLLLTTGGVYIVTTYVFNDYGKLNYVLSKITVAVIMSVCYNYVLHKKFVFK